MITFTLIFTFGYYINFHHIDGFVSKIKCEETAKQITEVLVHPENKNKIKWICVEK